MLEGKVGINSKSVLSMVGLSFLFGILIFQSYVLAVEAWGNGPRGDALSVNPLDPKYGTHDWIAQHALDWLPDGEKAFIENNLNAFLLGTEMPDNAKLVGGLGDNPLHILFYFSNQSLQNNASARRALSEFERVIDYLNYEEDELAAKCAGKMSHYIADLAVFGHVMDMASEWDPETHHDDFEKGVGKMTTSYSTSIFDSVLIYDGSLSEIDAYNAALKLGYTTTFGDGGDIKNCTWMDENYSWSNPSFNTSAKESINLAVNLLTDVLHTINVRANPGSGSRANHIVVSEVYYDTSGTESLEEYLELYNPTINAVDISEWRVETVSKTYTIPAGSTIRPGSYFTLARNGDNFLASYGKTADVGDLSIPLANSKGNITLKDSGDQPIDSVAWENPFSGWDITTSSKGGKTIQRIPVDVDTDTDSEWMSNSLQTPMVQSEVPSPPLDMTPVAIAGAVGAAAAAGLYTFKRKKKRTYHCPVCNVPLFSVPTDLPVPEEKEVVVCPNGHKAKVPAFPK